MILVIKKNNSVSSTFLRRAAKATEHTGSYFGRPHFIQTRNGFFFRSPFIRLFVAVIGNTFPYSNKFNPNQAYICNRFIVVYFYSSNIINHLKWNQNGKIDVFYPIAHLCLENVLPCYRCLSNYVSLAIFINTVQLAIGSTESHVSG